MRQLALILALTLVHGAAVAQDIHLQALHVINGSCSVVVNGADVGCDGKAALTVLGNGRTLFNFTASDIATLGFAGGQLQSMEPEHNVLWVDGVYLNQNKTPADGQCALEGSGTAAAKVTCRALLTDGRKVSATLSGQMSQVTFPGNPGAAQKGGHD